MGRKTQITKEMILDASYELLDEGGINAVAIKSIASKLGCSTQPISWHFGSMTELKKELFLYAGSKMAEAMERCMEGRGAVEAFFMTGVQYISIACDHPNVFRFLSVDEPRQTIGEDVMGETSLFTLSFDPKSSALLASEYGLSEKEVSDVVRDVVIYTHGLAVMMMYDSYKLPKKVACRMVFDVGDKMLAGVGLNISDKQKKTILKAAGI